MLTYGGVELDIKNSNFKVKYADYVFYFSSEFYKKKFESNVDNFVKVENIKIQNKYKVKIDLKQYFAVVYYKLVEKRGFYIAKIIGSDKLPKFKVNSYIDTEE